MRHMPFVVWFLGFPLSIHLVPLMDFISTGHVASKTGFDLIDILVYVLIGTALWFSKDE